MSSNATNDFAAILVAFRATDWHALGRDDADGLIQDIEEDGYAGVDGTSPWDDARPDAADALHRADSDFDLDDDEDETRESALDKAREAYNDGWADREQEMLAEHLD